MVSPRSGAAASKPSSRSSAANAVIAQDVATGALALLYGATEPELSDSEYIGPGGFQNMCGHPAEQRSSKRSSDEKTAARLWGVSEELTGVTYHFDIARTV